MSAAFNIFPFLLLLSPAAAIECYSVIEYKSLNVIHCFWGLKLIAGQSVGTATIQCDNSGSMCYNMTASAAVVLDVVKAGCSLWRCMLARDRCISTTFQNVPISLCCCSTDRCNVGENVGMKQVGGWNAAPEHEEHLTKEEIAHRFSSMEVDDEVQATASRGNRHHSSSPRSASPTNPSRSSSHVSTDEVQIP